MTRGALRGRVIDGHGVAHTVRISSDDLLAILLDGDLEPTLRSEFPAAVRSAADGDTARWRGCRRERKAAKKAKREARARASTTRSTTRPAAKTSSSLEPRGHARDAPGRSERPDPRAFSERNPPFTPANVLDLSDMQACAFWPYTTPAPMPTPNEEPLPERPDADPERADDLRTPTANAREVAAQIPGSHLW